jgi:hypothetical protein
LAQVVLTLYLVLLHLRVVEVVELLMAAGLTVVLVVVLELMAQRLEVETPQRHRQHKEIQVEYHLMRTLLRMGLEVAVEQALLAHPEQVLLQVAAA